MWIHNKKNWNHFSWDHKIIDHYLFDVRFKQGLFLGRMQSLNIDLKQTHYINTISDDIVRSFAIEDHHLNADEVRSSVASRLGRELKETSPTSRNVNGLVSVFLDATQNFKDPLTKKRLCHWHKLLFLEAPTTLSPLKVGDWRQNPMQVVSGPIGRERLHYEAPCHNRLGFEMDTFLKWFNSFPPVDPILFAAIAHFWFISIHPFDDGNGRIARVICDMALARADGSPKRYYSLSTQIETDRLNYYNSLEQQQCSCSDITTWLSYFLNTYQAAILHSEKQLDDALSTQKKWGHIDQFPINQRQRTVLKRLIHPEFKGLLNSSKYAIFASCSQDTALRDIKELIAYGLLTQNQAGGRSTSYRLLTELTENAAP